MDATHAALNRAASASRLLGWINFSDGRPDPKWQRQLDDAYDAAVGASAVAPWTSLRDWLVAELGTLEHSGNAAFRDCSQARAVIALVFDEVLPAYRQHHSDLLAHLSDADLFTAFFVARVFEAVLAQGSPWSESDRITRGALRKLNDFVGHRPIAVLESRPQTDFYPHERVRPVPLYLKGAGVAHGRYREMIALALDILEKTDPDLLHEACFDLNLLDELAFDPRPYDHGHPVNRRPNYLFGEWDPHHIDEQGRFRRFIVRKATLDAILTRIPGEDSSEVTRAERIQETGAVLAGTILMAAGTSGTGPTTFDSTVTLSKLVPRIARYRDAFYKRLIAGIGGEHGEKLRIESQKFRQPFGSARQHLNQELARQRAVELQETHVALAFAEMGYPEASRKRAAGISAVSVRMLAEMRSRLASGQLAVEKGLLAEATTLLSECEDLLHRGIACGAIADPWNAIGFQGLFPLFHSREDSVRDSRLDDLIETMSRVFLLYADLLAAAASAGEDELGKKLTRNLERTAAWWDKHATFEVSDLPRVHGGERAAAAAHVATALASVHGSSSSANDLAFWRQHRDGFRAPSAFAQVVDALLRQGNLRAAMALLMTWLSEAGEIPLEEGEASFHALARRWLREAIESSAPTDERLALVTRFFAHLEVNADELWSVPKLDDWTSEEWPERDEDEPEDVFEAAYEEMSYRDSTDDGEEGAVAGGGERSDHFSLEAEADHLEDRLEFLATVARLWQDAAPFLRPHVVGNHELTDALAGWQATARSWQSPLILLLDHLHDLKIPEPAGGFEDVMEYDRRRILREQLAESVIETALEAARAVRLLGGLSGERLRRSEHDAPWELLALRLEAALGALDAGAVRKLLPRFLAEFRTQPLLFVPMSEGGHPRQILASRQAQTMLRSLLEQMPRLGLIRETYHLIQIAKTMEQNAPPEGRKISEFDHLFPIALQSVLETLLDAAHSWPPDDLAGDEALVDLLRRITDSFLTMWLAHSQTLRLSVLESPPPGVDWDGLREFVRDYGSDLFTPQFLALANLRSVRHRGIDSWLDSLANEPEPPKLWEHIESGELSRSRASACVEYVIQAMIEHHEEYRDYNSTTTQSDYGENLHLLLDFLKVKSNYDRYAWRMRPLVQAHAVLCRRGQDEAAVRWQASMAGFTRKLSDQLLDELTALEQEHGLKLRIIRDKLEERFVRPLVIDRLCAGVEPAMREAADPPGEGGAFARLEQQLHALTDKPIGIGLDVPEWLERLEDEVDEVRQRKADGEKPLPRGLAAGVSLSFADLQRQLAEWDKPI
jgi:hypothetical protein